MLWALIARLFFEKHASIRGVGTILATSIAMLQYSAEQVTPRVIDGKGDVVHCHSCTPGDAWPSYSRAWASFTHYYRVNDA